MATKTAKTAEPEKPADEASDSPLIDSVNKDVKKLLQKAKERGYVTYDEINEAMPQDQVTSEQIEDTMAMLSEMGINVVESEDEAEETTEEKPSTSKELTTTTPKEELDRFCDAMISIAAEADNVADGTWPENDNPLVNAPHTADVVTAAEWPHAYSRDVAVFPVNGLKSVKYWPSVGRIDNAQGDRTLVCTCPSMDTYRDAAE